MTGDDKTSQQYVRAALLVILFALATGGAYYAGRRSVIQEDRPNSSRIHPRNAPGHSELAHEAKEEAPPAEMAEATLAPIKQQIPTAETGSTGLIERVGQLKRILELYPELKLPEFKLLDDEDWLRAAEGMTEDTDGEAIQAISDLRQIAVQRFIPQITAAREQYQNEHRGVDASDPAQLARYIEDPELKDVLFRYTATNDPNWIYVDVPPEDCWFCSLTAIGRNSSAVMVSREWEKAFGRALEQFHAQNGRSPASAEEFTAYLKHPAPHAAIEAFLEKAQ